MRGLRSRFGHNFELVRWVTYVFIAGAINAAAIQGFGHYLIHMPQIVGRMLTPTDWPLFLGVPIALVLATPLILSIFLTRWKPEKQLIPPLYIQLVALAWFAGFILIRYPALVYPFLLAEGFYAFVWGAFLNIVTEYLLGISVSPDDFVSYSVSVNASPQRIREILEEEKFRKTLAIDWALEPEGRPNQFEFVADQAIYNFVFQVVPTDKLDESVINAIFFDRADWYVRPSNDVLKEYARSRVNYLKEVLSRAPFSLQTVDLPASNTGPLRSSIMREMQGVLPQFERISGTGWLKVIGFLVLLGIILGYAFYLKDYPTTVGFIVLLLVSLIFAEVRSSNKK